MQEPSRITQATPVEARALECIKRHLPALKQAYTKAGSRQLRLALKEFEALVRDEQSREH